MLFIIIMLTVICSSQVLCHGNYSIRISRAACTPSARIACDCGNCKYRQDYVDYRFVAVIENCKLGEVTINWRLRFYYEAGEKSLQEEVKLSKFNNKVVYNMKAKSVKVGYFSFLYLDVKAKIGGKASVAKIEIWMYPKQYFIEISYGNKITIPEGGTITVEILKPVIGWKVFWRTACTIRTSDEGCEDWMAAHKVSGQSCPSTPDYIIQHGEMKKNIPPAHKCIKVIVYKAEPDTYLQLPESFLWVYVDPSYEDILLAIMCVKNCGYAFNKNPVNPKKDTVLELKCFKNCDRVSKSAAFHVEVEEQPITEWKADGKMLTIFSNVANFGKQYQVSYREGEKVVAEVHIPVARKYPKMRCTVDPSSGKPILTDFEVKCDHTGETIHYMLRKYTFYQMKGSTKLKLLGTDHIPSKRTSIQSDEDTVQLRVEGVDMIGMPFESEPFSVELTREPLTKDILKKASEKIDYNRAAEDHPHALNVGSSLASSLENSKLSADEKKEAKRDIAKKMAGSIDKVELEDMRIVESALPAFYPVDEAYKDDLSKVCDVMSNNLPQGMAKAGNREKQQVSSKALMQCGSEIYAASNKKPEPTKGKENKTEKVPIEDEHLKEDYPDYDTEKGKEPSPSEQMGMKIMRKAAVVGGNDLEPGKEMRSEDNNDDKPSYLVTRDEADKMVCKEYKVVDVSVRTSRDMSKHGKDDIVLTIIRYPSSNQEGSTPLVEVGFYKNKELIKTIGGLKFYLKMPVKHFKENSNEFKCPVPKKLAELHYKMNCHRVKVKKTSLLIKFYNIQKVVKLQVSFSFNRRPEYEEFATNAYVLDGDTRDTYSFSFVSSSTDKFFYACVLPYRGKSKNIFGIVSNDTYNISFVSAECNSLNKENMWAASGCESIVDLGQLPSVTCRCSHTTVFSGLVRSITSDINKLERRDIKLQYFINWVIFGHVAAVIFIYSILLIFIVYRKSSSFGKDKLIFLSDNKKNDRYAYVVAVETGNALFSGTTSNVGIRLFGKYSKSEPHILNYPDPDKKLLQRHGLDWMIITTMKHLGPLTSIHLWFDSIGSRPQWRCESITVLDLQSRREQFFNVRTWFSMGSKHPICELRVVPTSKHKINKNIALQFRKYIRIYTGSEHTWNLIKSNDDYEFTYTQRLTVILSLIFTVYFICLVMLSNPKLKLMDEIGYGRFKFEPVLLYTPIVAALVAALINFPAVFLFRNSRHSFDKISLRREHKIFNSKILIFVWLLLLAWILFVTGYLIIFGFWITLNTSIYWIMSTITAILLLIFVLENIYLTLYNVISVTCGKKRKTYYSYKRIIEEIENQRKFLYKLFGEYLLRSYFTFHYKVLRGADYNITKIRETLRIQARLQLTDLIIFLCYILVMYYLSLCHTVELGHIANKFVQNIYSICKGIANEDRYCEERLYTIKSVYDYLNYTVLPQTFPEYWYGEFNINNPRLQSEGCNKLLGVIQLRQQRSEQICTLHRFLKKLGWHCSNDSKVFDNWPRKSVGLNSYSLGRVGAYNGEGYIINMGRTLRNARYTLSHLLNMNWIDINTKVLFIEFWTYNANHNFFNMVKIILERDRSGRYILTYSIYTSRFVFTGFIYYFNYIMILLLVILVFLITYRCIARWIAEKKGFLLVFWNAFDLTLATLNIIFLFLYFYRMMEIDSRLMELAKSDHNEYVDFSELEFIARSGVIVSAFILGMATLRVWSYLHFGIITFKVAERVMRKSLEDLFYTLLQHSIIFIGTSLLFYSLFGSNYGVFSTFAKSLNTMIVVSLNKIEEHNLNYIDLRLQGVSPYFLFAVFFITCTVFNNIYATIIMNAWTESKLYYSNKAMEYSIKDYFIQEMLFLTEKIKRHSANLRLRGGKDIVFEENNFVKPKDDVHRYASMLSLSKLQLRYMQLIAQAVIRKHNNLVHHREASHKDFELMARLVICMQELSKSKNVKDVSKIYNGENFICTKDLATHSPIFVENYRLSLMAIIVKQMVKPEPELEEYVFASYSILKRMGHFKKRLDAIRSIVRRVELIVSRNK